jgi:AcrR family transcriptional regulator
MSQIASEAKLSVGQIYRYFSNKDAIIEEMIRRIIDSRIEEMQAKRWLKGCRRRSPGDRRSTKMTMR